MKDRAQSSRGPEDDIRKNMTVGELVVRYPRLRQDLETLGIDYCCGGKIPLGTAVEEAGLTWSDVLERLQGALAARSADEAETDWGVAPLSQLADHILEKHHTFLKEQLPRLDRLLTKTQQAHGAQHGDTLDGVRRVYDGLRFELDSHLMKEEQILFPAIKAIDAFMSGQGARPVIHCGSIVNPIQQMEIEHVSAGNALVELRQITDNYRLPADACETFAAVYDGLKDMESDLHEHIHLENNILYPKSIALEAAM